MLSFATIYDEFMKDVNYFSWYKFLRRYIKKKGKVLDLGTGTGNISKRFSQDGFFVTGIDISLEMIEIARKKDDKTEYIQSDLLKFEAKEQFEYIVCNFDTVNYLKNKNDLKTFLKKSYSNLKKGGFLIFDAVSEEIFEEIFENNLFVDTVENYTCIWFYEKLRNNNHRISMEIFYKLKNGLYQKIEQIEEKHIFDFNEILSLSQEQGFTIYDTASNSEFGKRMFFILKK